jgi:hypothetical protein
VTPEEEVERGEQAALLLHHPLMVEARTKIKTELMDAWQQSPARDVDGRETLWLSVKLLEQVMGHLETVVQTGQLAAHDLSRRGVMSSTASTPLRLASSRR